VLPFARAALDAVARARLAVDELAGLVRGQVTVGMVSGCALPVLAELLASFHKQYPGVAISLTEDNSDRLLEMLRDGRLDLALIGSAGAEAEGSTKISTAVLIDEELVAAVPPGHPLAGRETLTITSLRDVPLVCLPRGTGVRAALDAACAAAGFEPRIVFEASALPMVVTMAAQGLGLAVVPASVANAPHADGAPVIVPIAHPEVRSRLELAWPEAASGNPAARVLTEQARAQARALRLPS
jgi:DNA-binding transcriptional LysR family regulator